MLYQSTKQLNVQFTQILRKPNKQNIWGVFLKFSNGESKPFENKRSYMYTSHSMVYIRDFQTTVHISWKSRVQQQQQQQRFRTFSINMVINEYDMGIWPWWWPYWLYSYAQIAMTKVISRPNSRSSCPFAVMELEIRRMFMCWYGV